MDLWHLAKAPALLLVVAAEHIAFNPPTKPPTKEVADRSRFGRRDLIAWSTGKLNILNYVSVNFNLPGPFQSNTFIKFVLYPPQVIEAIAVVAREFPSPLSTRILSILLSDPATADRLVIERTFVAGFLLIIFGGIIRKICYDTLGKFFTYQLAVFKDHKLVTTGPYGVVRHPAYTGFLLASTGLLLVMFTPGSYLWESGILGTWWKAALWGLWAFVSVIMVQVSAVKRVPREDMVLRQQFGTEWEAWAQRTRYKLVPYLY